MPLIYGQSQDMNFTSNDIDQYTKWFNLMEMDFELLHIGNSWICEAWSRNGEIPTSTSAPKKTVTEALHACYSDIRFSSTRDVSGL
jgi:hypothetical protein